MTRKLFLAALTAAAMAPMALAQNPAATATPNQDANTGQKQAVSDQLFAAAAASGGLAEVSIAQLGVRKATDPELKKFSQHMIDEHTKVNQELAALAARKGVAVPNAPDARAAFCGQSLAGLSGEEFDRCYAKAQLLAHMDAAAAFEAEAERGLDADMKAFASKTLPHIKEHLKTIKPIAMRYEKEMKDEKDEAHHSDKAK